MQHNDIRSTDVYLQNYESRNEYQTDSVVRISDSLYIGAIKLTYNLVFI